MFVYASHVLLRYRNIDAISNIFRRPYKLFVDVSTNNSPTYVELGQAIDLEIEN